MRTRGHQSDQPITDAPRSVGGWFAPKLVVAFIILWSLLIYALIGDRPSDWQYGVFPYVPGQSIFSTSRVPSTPPKQVELPARIRMRMHGM